MNKKKQYNKKKTPTNKPKEQARKRNYIQKSKEKISHYSELCTDHPHQCGQQKLVLN